MRIALATTICCLIGTLADGAELVDYQRDVKRILKERCFACHGALKQESELRLDTVAFIRQGGERGPAIEAGNSATSTLIEAVTGSEGWIMPPEDQGTPLTSHEIDLLKRWINEGANAPPDEQAEVDPRQHWAFQSPRRPQLPRVENPAWVRNSVDTFIAAQHQRRGLRPASPATRPGLLRRLYLDLTGLPPTRNQLHDFLADDSPRAYEDVVDRLLASPQYAERWARHWMDVWRYSDWYGRRSRNDVRNSYPHVWRWRDWIIDSLATDKGYDQMVTEMLAADEIAPEDDDTIVATGYLVRNWYKLNYNIWMKDLVEHTGKAFLSLTLNCAMCHDHKYDPITQEEYFKFRAFFEPLELRQDRVPGLPDPGPYTGYVYGSSMKPIEAGLARVFDKNLDAQTFMFVLGDERNRMPGKPPVSPGPPSSLLGDHEFTIHPVQLPAVAYYPGMKGFVRGETLAVVTGAVEKARAKLASIKESDADNSTLTRHELAAAEASLCAVNARLAADQAKYAKRPHNEVLRLAGLASQAEREMQLSHAQSNLVHAQWELKQVPATGQADEQAADPKALAAATKQVDTCKKAVDEARAALEQPSTVYTPLGPHYPESSTGRRTGLARWITDRRNPLTARVAVNHIWLRHFGSPLVLTVSDFGRNGKPPTHPQLLDWLAVELMEHNWSMQHIHRLLVTSNAYRMQSNSGKTTATNANAALDRANDFLWRANSRRMEAEVVRDALLYVAGELDLTIGGQELDVQSGETAKRRSIYFAHHDEGRMQFLQMFDAPDPNDCYRRTETIVPQQALALANSRMARNLSRQLARMINEAYADQRDFITVSFESILARGPTESERAACERFLTNQLALYSRDDFQPGENEKDDLPASANPHLRARESLIQVLLSHNDFVTIR